MGQIPSDSEIIRLSDQLDTNMIRKLVIHLGLTMAEWSNMRDNHLQNSEELNFFILIRWRNKKMGIFNDLNKALPTICVTNHKLCQVGS